MKPDTEKLRKKYMDNPPEGMTSEDIRCMSEDDLLDMDYFLNEDDLLDDEAGVEGFYILSLIHIFAAQSGDQLFHQFGVLFLGHKECALVNSASLDGAHLRMTGQHSCQLTHHGIVPVINLDGLLQFFTVKGCASGLLQIADHPQMCIRDRVPAYRGQPVF